MQRWHRNSVVWYIVEEGKELQSHVGCIGERPCVNQVHQPYFILIYAMKFAFSHYIHVGPCHHKRLIRQYGVILGALDRCRMVCETCLVLRRTR